MEETRRDPSEPQAKPRVGVLIPTVTKQKAPVDSGRERSRHTKNG